MPIRRLEAGVVAGISAGEVIERPASIVKELVENALDAGATRVTVALEGGGLRLIRITDDGSGIPPGETVLAFERHATSKLVTLDDLGRLGTYGFRGEALAAVVAAGEVELQTRPAAAPEGVRVTGGAGAPLVAAPAGCPAGTSLSIRRLFATMPARLKFMRSPQAESAAAARVVEAYVLTRPDVHFVLTVDGEERLNAPPARDPALRARAVVGEAVLVPFARTEDGFTVRGLAEAPGAVHRRGRQWLFVNGRPIEDRALRHAVISAYGGQIPRETQPQAAVFVEASADRVDVNVHPAKSEVRFADPSAAYRVLLRAVRDGFAAAGVTPNPVQAAGEAPAGSGAGEAAEPAPGEPGAAESWEWGAPGPGGLEVLGQLFRTYIVARTPEGLIVVDQHTAHEKVIFERLAERVGERASQGLLVPQTLDLSPAELLLLEGRGDALRELGFALEPFGGRSVAVHAVPAEAADRDLEPMLHWLLEDLEQAGRATSREATSRKMRASIACHLATKAGDPLGRGEMEGIVRGLMALADPTSCPHGRPTFVRHDEADLARAFRRTWGLGKRECH